MQFLSITRRNTLRLVLVVISCSISFAILELAARYHEYHERWLRTSSRSPLFCENQHKTGSYRVRPNLELRVRMGNKKINIKTNAFGMHGRDTKMDKTQGRTRIAFIGDSFTFGEWADNSEKSFVGVVESSTAARNYECLNFGVGGYGLDDMELLLKEEVFKFHPDDIVLIFFNGNDFRDTYLGLNKYKIVEGQTEWDEDVLSKKIPAEYRTTRKSEYRLTRNRDGTASKLRSYLYGRLAAYRALSSLKARILGVISNQGGDSLFMDELIMDDSFTSYSFWSRSEYPDVALRAKHVGLQYIEDISSYVHQIGARLFIVALPYRDQVYSRRMHGKGYDLEYPQRYVELFANEHNLPYLDLLPELRAYVREKNADLYLRQDPHLNNEGHQVVGQMIARWFIDTVDSGVH